MCLFGIPFVAVTHRQSLRLQGLRLALTPLKSAMCLWVPLRRTLAHTHTHTPGALLFAVTTAPPQTQPVGPEEANTLNMPGGACLHSFHHAIHVCSNHERRNAHLVFHNSSCCNLLGQRDFDGVYLGMHPVETLFGTEVVRDAVTANTKERRERNVSTAQQTDLMRALLFPGSLLWPLLPSTAPHPLTTVFSSSIALVCCLSAATPFCCTASYVLLYPSTTRCSSTAFSSLLLQFLLPTAVLPVLPPHCVSLAANTLALLHWHCLRLSPWHSQVPAAQLIFMPSCPPMCPCPSGH